MLPSILHVAEQYNLISDPKTYGKKESLFKCPFCKQDSLPRYKKKYYLSLNTNKNVFKCWYCEKKGGVLYFESLLSERPYEEIREKYLGKRKSHIHPAFRLSPDQLKQIGWLDKKQKNFQAFQKQKNQVIKDWRKYEYEELKKHYALFLLITHFPIKNERETLYKWFNQICQKSIINNIYKKIIKQFNSPKENWAIEGKEIAKIAYIISRENNDLINLFTNILFVHELQKFKKINTSPSVKEMGN